MVQLYVDLDGVLANFDTHYKEVFGIETSKALDNVDWDAVRESQNFFRDMPPMPDMLELWARVAPYSPIILTGVPILVPEAESNKRAWVIKHLGEHVPVIGCKSADKCTYAEPGDILIDDWTKYQHRWLEVGGVWITHTSAASTLDQLEPLGYVEIRRPRA